MSNSDKVKKKTGKIHKCSKVEPNHQSKKSTDQGISPRALATEKPDFDTKDRMATPERKASGPKKKRRHSPPTSPGVVPEVKIKSDSTKDDL